MDRGHHVANNDPQFGKMIPSNNLHKGDSQPRCEKIIENNCRKPSPITISKNNDPPQQFAKNVCNKNFLLRIPYVNLLRNHPKPKVANHPEQQFAKKK